MRFFVRCCGCLFCFGCLFGLLFVYLIDLVVYYLFLLFWLVIVGFDGLIWLVLELFV